MILPSELWKRGFFAAGGDPADMTSVTRDALAVADEQVRRMCRFVVYQHAQRYNTHPMTPADIADARRICAAEKGD